MSAVLPHEPHQPGFLERCACAYADDLAFATASFPASFSPLSRLCPSTTKSANGFNMATMLSERVGTHVLVFQLMQIKYHARYLGVEIGPGAANHRWTKVINTFVPVCACIRTSSQSLVHRFVSFKILRVVCPFLHWLCRRTRRCDDYVRDPCTSRTLGRFLSFSHVCAPEAHAV